MTEDEDRVRAIVLDSPVLRPLLSRWAEIDLPDGWLSGSVIAQTAWNAIYALPADHGLADIDLVYFDDADLSEASEKTHADRVRALFPKTALRIDVKNEARVHLWYQAKFGYPIEPYRSVRHAISTFPTTAGAVAIRPGPVGLDIFAPFGLTDLLGCAVRANKRQITREIYEAKVGRWRACWPALTILPWDDDSQGSVDPPC